MNTNVIGIRTYFLLTKPGIIFGNLITTAGGFALASKGHLNFYLFLVTLVGLGLVIGSACIFNNYMDRHADEKMERTKNRPFVQKSVSVKFSLFLASFMVVLGSVILGLYANVLAMIVALVGFFGYVILYGICKYRSVYGTIVGSLAGAAPPVVGYCAVSGTFDLGAALLYIILVLWQMPHFFAIAMYRFRDYAAASVPVLPVKRGNHVTKIHMLLYVIAFMIAAFMLTLLHFTGYIYLAVVAILGSAWAWLSIKGFKAENDIRWAREMFVLSLVVITALSIVLSFDVIKG